MASLLDSFGNCFGNSRSSELVATCLNGNGNVRHSNSMDRLGAASCCRLACRLQLRHVVVVAAMAAMAAVVMLAVVLVLVGWAAAAAIRPRREK